MPEELFATWQTAGSKSPPCMSFRLPCDVLWQGNLPHPAEHKNKTCQTCPFNSEKTKGSMIYLSIAFKLKTFPNPTTIHPTHHQIYIPDLSTFTRFCWLYISSRPFFGGSPRGFTQTKTEPRWHWETFEAQLSLLHFESGPLWLLKNFWKSIQVGPWKI